MSLITCCPACQTMFRVVPDQLRISEGWVRCGHCSEVFDAAAHLQDRLPGPAAPPPSRVALEEAPAEDTSPVAVVDAAELAEAASATEIASSSYPPFVLRREDTTDSIFGAALAPAPLPQPPEAQQPVAVASRPASVDAQDSLAPDDGAPDLQDLSFVRQARRDAYWRRPGARVLLSLAALLLAALLAGQFALHERDRLAAMFPQLRPGLEQMCEAIACSIAAPRQIDAIVIEGSSFNKLRGDAYRLSFTLKNLGAFDVAVPSVELTLTDTQDQPVLRRVLRPSDFAGNAADIAAASDKAATLAVGVAAGAASARIAGYRLLAFYP